LAQLSVIMYYVWSKIFWYLSIPLVEHWNRWPWQFWELAPDQKPRNKNSIKAKGWRSAKRFRKSQIHKSVNFAALNFFKLWTFWKFAELQFVPLWSSSFGYRSHLKLSLIQNTVFYESKFSKVIYLQDLDPNWKHQVKSRIHLNLMRILNTDEKNRYGRKLKKIK
jgi:hypothetical protein